MATCIITPDRNDRPTLLKHCLKQVSRFTTSFDAHVIVNYQPRNQQKDLRERIKYGYDEAVRLGIDWVVIIENDDWYHKEYLHRVLLSTDKADFIGCEFSYYYNLKNRTWGKLIHRGRASLYTTAFRVEAMKNFAWHRADDVFVDLNIWQYAKRFRRKFIDAGAIGIKHGMGLCGGKGHVMKFKNEDPEMKWLESKVDSDSFEFYKNLRV